ncbi:distal membrane-arm assembly complex protein 2, partial [Phasianus colchicus]|uniref:distal membrane-arm assembly complex protein 2 n=1 Tax=Phasianus colchicus TaxID=9054 RepID=UPI00129DB66A
SHSPSAYTPWLRSASSSKRGLDRGPHPTQPPPQNPPAPRRPYSFVQTLHGNNVAAACFAMSCGGRVRFEGQERWLCADSRGRWSPEVLQFHHVPVVALDLSGTEVTYDGLDNIVLLTKLQHLDLSGCPHVDDWALGRLHVFGDSLQELSVARCPRVTERGLATLHQLP